MGQLNLWDIWTSGLWVDKHDQANFYRPIFSTSIWLDQLIFGRAASGYHWHSLGWHMLNVILFASLCGKILPKAQQMIALSLFATHPLMSEIVFWIAARNDLIALTFILLFMNAFWDKGAGTGGFPAAVQRLSPKQMALLGGFSCWLCCLKKSRSFCCCPCSRACVMCPMRRRCSVFSWLWWL